MYLLMGLRYGASFKYLGLNATFRVTGGIRRHSSNMQDVSAEPVECVSTTTGLGRGDRWLAVHQE